MKAIDNLYNRKDVGLQPSVASPNFVKGARANWVIGTNGQLSAQRPIATNLISNAIKYSPTGGDVRVLLHNGDGQYVLSVRDHALGISEADQVRLLNAFQRGKNVGRIQGTGLGLAIVKQAVDLLGGTTRLESQLGVGTTMNVTLPCAPNLKLNTEAQSEQLKM